jgi:hypothetical protein
MSKIIVRSASDGVHLSAEVLSEAGIEPGAVVELEMAPLPDAGEIGARALRFTTWKLGDAIGVGQPQWVDGGWKVALYAPGGTRRIGDLYLDSRGEVILEKSSTYESVRRV